MKTARMILAGLLAAIMVACAAVALRETGAEPSALETETESARLNVWFEQVFDEAVARDPMRQTILGIKDRYGEWSDPSDAFAEAELGIERANVAYMRANFDFDRLDSQAKLSWRLAEFELERAEAAFPWRRHGYTFNQMFGVQSGIPAFLISQHKVTSEADAAAYVQRLEGIPAYLGQHAGNARAAAAASVQPPAFVYDYVLSDARGVISGHPFDAESNTDSPIMADFRSKVEVLVTNGSITADTAGALIGRAEAALKEQVGPAYQSAIDELERQKAAATTDDGAWKLPDGAAFYNARLAEMTTTDLTADEIHAVGLAEVARIQNEMQAIMARVEFDGTLPEFFEFMRTDPRFFKAETAEGKAEYLAEAEAAISAMRADLPKLFNTFPEANLVVRAVEPFREKSAGKAFYNRPAPDGSRPGIYYANLSSMADMPTYQLEALAFHEGIPGHHMQLAIAQELKGIPSFRKFGSYTAYSEGWGLYSERVPKEMGYYADPYADFGRLAMEIWRAARLVVDTGIHHKQWTREEAVQYLLDNTPNPRGDCERAIDRYIVMPGQATAYTVGMLKILELRDRARGRLGDQFDIRAFHDVVLRNGPLPLAILEETVDAWIEETAE
jgi:uncharacterized protein (DUF885 family)